jgi:histidinol-phosphatase (PHP family)
VLTDYHVHLRPDEDGASASKWFTPQNATRYREAARAAGIEELGVSEHVYRFRQALDVWDHAYWRDQATDDLDAYCEFVRSTDLRLGIEADFVPGGERALAALLEAREFDYVIGSVHFVGELAVDFDDKFDVWEGDESPDEIWGRYFEMLAAAARSGLFDVLAHPDLVKIWGRARPLPERDPRSYYEPAVEAIAESGVAVEISTISRPRACASRSGRSTRRPSSRACARTRGRRSRSPRTPTSRSSSATHTIGPWSFWESWA